MKYITYLLVALCLGAAVICAAAETHGTESPLTPVSTILKSDGTVDLSAGFCGGLDVKSYRMVADADGVPRFVSSSAASGPAPDADDVTWDDQFLPRGTDHDVRAMAVDKSGRLYIAGLFTMAGGTRANRIACWDGSSWSALGSGIDGGEVSAVAVSAAGDVYAGGSFTTAGGVKVKNIAKWDGKSWSALGGGVQKLPNQTESGKVNKIRGTGPREA